jgi:hypothetical protein
MVTGAYVEANKISDGNRGNISSETGAKEEQEIISRKEVRKLS